MNPENVITIKILERFYKIKCSPQEAIELQEAAEYIDREMRKIRQSGPISSPDRMAIVVALNTYCELNRLKKQKNQGLDHVTQRINDLQKKIQHTLAEDEKIPTETKV